MSGDPSATATTRSETSPTPENPKDARGLVACEMLTSEQLTRLGLDPATGDQIGIGQSQGCTWNAIGTARWTAGLTMLTDLESPALDAEYVTADLAAVFEPMIVAGHPAVRDDVIEGQPCRLAIAVARHQKLGIVGDFPDALEGTSCASAIRMAEFVLANLPPLTRSER